MASTGIFIKAISGSTRLQRFHVPLLLLSIAALPFELVISVVRSRIVAHIGPVGYFFHPALGVLIGGIALLPGTVLSRSGKVILAGLAMYAAGIVLSAAVNQALLFHIISILLLGPVSMGVVFWLLQRSDLVSGLLAAFVIGQAAWAGCFLLLCIWNATVLAGMEPAILQRPIGGILLALKGGTSFWDNMIYYKLLGNFNKQANLLTLALVMAAYLLVRHDLGRRTWLVCSGLMGVMLMLMFSRGAFVALGAVSAGLIVTSRRSTEQMIAGALLALLCLFSFSTPEWRSYWFNSASMVQREEMVSGAFTGAAVFRRDGELLSSRTDATQESAETDASCQAHKLNPSVSFFIFGYGLGKYGPTICRLPEAESHNAFVDAWINGGVAGAIGYMLLFIASAFEAARRAWRSHLRDKEAVFGLALVGAVALLSMREYALVYLWVQSSGGFALAAGLALSTRQPDA